MVELDDDVGKRVLDLHSPCKTDETIYCYVNRYREKTIILLYMVIFTVISISLTIAELILFSCKYGFKTHKPPNERRGLAKRHMDKKMKKDKGYFQSRHPEYAVLNDQNGIKETKLLKPGKAATSSPKGTLSVPFPVEPPKAYPELGMGIRNISEEKKNDRNLKRLNSNENSLNQSSHSNRSISAGTD